MARFTLKIGNHLKMSQTKRTYNEQVFTVIAKRYDFITKALSFWQDSVWKRALINQLPNTTLSSCVDIACGTGDLTFLLAKKYPDAAIVGIDITESMLEISRMRNQNSNIVFTKSDMQQMTCADSSVDVLTGGYALRNAPDLMATIDEIYRVLKPGGYAAFLDFSKPSSKIKQVFEYYLLKIWAGLWGVLFHGNHEVYSYIAESLKLYPDRQSLKQVFKDKGFEIISSQLKFLGITEIMILQKKS